MSEPISDGATRTIDPVPAAGRRARTASADRLRQLGAPVRGLLAGGGLGIWLGLLVTAAGFAVIVVAWVKVAALVNVALQMPYVVSGGFTGLALVVVGIALVDIAVRRQDGAERQRQMLALRRVLEELQAVQEDRP